jgi:hypothetical protein
MPDRAKTILSVGLAIVALIGFLLAFGYSILYAWTGPLPPAQDALVSQARFIFVANLLAGLIGGVVATGFGQQLPSPPDNPPANPPDNPPANPPSIAESVGNITDAGNVLPRRWTNIIGTGYALIYFLIGLAAIISWLIKGDDIPDIVNNISGVCLGLIVAIVQSALGSRGS